MTAQGDRVFYPTSSSACARDLMQTQPEHQLQAYTASYQIWFVTVIHISDTGSIWFVTVISTSDTGSIWFVTVRVLQVQEGYKPVPGNG